MVLLVHDMTLRTEFTAGRSPARHSAAIIFIHCRKYVQIYKIFLGKQEFCVTFALTCDILDSDGAAGISSSERSNIW